MAMVSGTAARPGTAHTSQDVTYAGMHLLAVADGEGIGGEILAQAAIDIAASHDHHTGSDTPLDAVRLLFIQANTTIRALKTEQSGIGDDARTTLTVLLFSGDLAALGHIGNTRAYLLRQAEMFQITYESEPVCVLGLTPEELAKPRPSLFDVLDGRPDLEPQLTLRATQPGDRYLLCTDGLTTPTDPEQIHEILTATPDAATAVKHLIDLAEHGGGADDITCIVADLSS